MALSEATLNKLREESESLGGRVYDDTDAPDDVDVTSFGEDDNPLKLAGDPVDDDPEVTWKEG